MKRPGPGLATAAGGLGRPVKEDGSSPDGKDSGNVPISYYWLIDWLKTENEQMDAYMRPKKLIS